MTLPSCDFKSNSKNPTPLITDGRKHCSWISSLQKTIRTEWFGLCFKCWVGGLPGEGKVPLGLYAAKQLKLQMPLIMLCTRKGMTAFRFLTKGFPWNSVALRGAENAQHLRCLLMSYQWAWKWSLLRRTHSGTHWHSPATFCSPEGCLCKSSTGAGVAKEVADQIKKIEWLLARDSLVWVC